MMIDIAHPGRIVVLTGKGGRLARWRHAFRSEPQDNCNNPADVILCLIYQKA